MEKDTILIELVNYEAVKAVVMALLEDGYTVQLIKWPESYAVRTWKEEE